jgi:4-hydroxy-4-methyl-2-oxoglutarate aldolase
MFDVVKNFERVSPEWIEKYSRLDESASVCESLSVNGALNHDFRPVWPEMKTVGSAVTVRARAGDNLILHKAITMLRPGDFLVVTCDGFHESGGMWGGIMSTAAVAMGAVGMVIDGCVRDSVVLRQSGFKVWSRGLSVKKSTKLVPGQINIPITIGNVNVCPGDLVFADNDGVIIVPHENIKEVYERTVAREEKESRVLEEVKKDGTYLFYHNPFHETYQKLELKEES